CSLCFPIVSKSGGITLAIPSPIQRMDCGRGRRSPRYVGILRETYEVRQPPAHSWPAFRRSTACRYPTPSVRQQERRSAMTTNRKPSLLDRVGGFIDVLGSAVAVSGALQGRREPKAHDLMVLGIEPNQFRSMGRF